MILHFPLNSVASHILLLITYITIIPFTNIFNLRSILLNRNLYTLILQILSLITAPNLPPIPKSLQKLNLSPFSVSLNPGFWKTLGLVFFGFCCCCCFLTLITVQCVVNSVSKKWNFVDRVYQNALQAVNFSYEAFVLAVTNICWILYIYVNWVITQCFLLWLVCCFESLIAIWPSFWYVKCKERSLGKPFHSAGLQYNYLPREVRKVSFWV